MKDNLCMPETFRGFRVTGKKKHLWERHLAAISVTESLIIRGKMPLPQKQSLSAIFS